MVLNDPNFQAVLARIPDYSALPAFDEMDARTQGLKAMSNASVTVRTVGQSTSGTPIDLISIGKGSPSVLLVGAPHPNEPVGCLTIEYLIDQLVRHPELLDHTRCTWHFIKAIEPDALRMNEGWFKKPGNPIVYLQHFYRPALADQAEYSFPLSIPGYQFVASTPENLAYQEAIRLTSPDLLYSLHNAEFGGVFYLMTHDVQGLAAELSRQPPVYGLAVDEIGEPTAQGQALARGVFEAPNTLKFAAAPGFYNAGKSAFDHAKALHGTLGLMAEIPYWQPRGRYPTTGAMTVESIFAPLVRLIHQVERMAIRHQAIHQLAQSSQDARLSRAIRENLIFLGMYRDLYSNIPDGKYLPSDAARHCQAMCLVTLRPVSMLARLCDQLLARNGDDTDLRLAYEEASDLLATASRDQAVIGDMESVPLRTTVTVQVAALLAATTALKRNASLSGLSPD